MCFVIPLRQEYGGNEVKIPTAFKMFYLRPHYKKKNGDQVFCIVFIGINSLLIK